MSEMEYKGAGGGLAAALIVSPLPAAAALFAPGEEIDFGPPNPFLTDSAAALSQRAEDMQPTDVTMFPAQVAAPAQPEQQQQQQQRAHPPGRVKVYLLGKSG